MISQLTHIAAQEQLESQLRSARSHRQAAVVNAQKRDIATFVVPEPHPRRLHLRRRPQIAA